MGFFCRFGGECILTIEDRDENRQMDKNGSFSSFSFSGRICTKCQSPTLINGYQSPESLLVPGGSSLGLHWKYNTGARRI